MKVSRITRRLGITMLPAAVIIPGLVSSTPQASAGPNIWTTTAPTALVGVVARDNAGDVFAAADGESTAAYNGLSATTIYRSTDSGQTWTNVGDYAHAAGVGPGNYATPQYLAASGDGRTLLLNVRTGGGLSLIRSTDGGQIWSQVLAGFESTNIVFDPTNNNRVYSNGKGALYRSTDGGATWKSMPGTEGGDQYTFAGRLAVDPANPAHLVEITKGSVKVSNNYGDTWTSYTPAPDPLVQDRAVPQPYSGGGSLVFVPRPSGASWALASDEEGMYISRDAGLNWLKMRMTPQSKQYLPGSALGLDVSGNTMYIQSRNSYYQQNPSSPQDTYDALLSSTDGISWQVVSRLGFRREPLTIYGQSAIFASRRDHNLVFRADGLFSSDGGQHWGGPAANLPTITLDVQSFTMSQSVWYAGAGLNLYRSSDAGLTWLEFTPYAEYQNGPLNFNFDSISGIGVSGNNILLQLFPKLVTGGPGGHYITQPLVVRSSDAGATWQATGLVTSGGQTRFTFGSNTVYAVSAPNNRYIGSYVSQGAPGGLFRSTDGAAWTRLPLTTLTNNLIIDPADANHLLVAGDDGLAESRDAGNSWMQIHTNPQVGGFVYNEPGSFNTLYADGTESLDQQNGIQRGPLYKSTDAGKTWTALPINNLDPKGYRVRSFYVAGQGHIIMSWIERTVQSGVQLSESFDGGKTWKSLNKLNMNGTAADMFYDTDRGTIIALGSGLYSYKTVSVAPDPAFNKVWVRQDELVASGDALRSWTWGEAPFATQREVLSGLPGNSRVVQYWDKSRMEVNDPNADRKSPWFVTNGLLTVEMVAGRVQTGLNSWDAHPPALVPVAGDGNVTDNPDAPTYSAFRKVASYENGNNMAPDRTGQTVKQSIDGLGNVGASVPATNTVTLAKFDASGGHNIAQPFWEFLNRTGKITDPAYPTGTGPIFQDWVFVMGLPISEPYWATMRVGGQSKQVLIQLFERRVLTYTPSNAPEWRVEMGNVGLHYFVWRYGDAR